MGKTLEIRKSTGVTVSVAVAGIILAAVFAAASWYTSVNAKISQNEQEISNLRPEIKELNRSLQTTNDNLNTTNLNVVELQTLIIGLQDELGAN